MCTQLLQSQTPLPPRTRQFLSELAPQEPSLSPHSALLSAPIILILHTPQNVSAGERSRQGGQVARRHRLNTGPWCRNAASVVDVVLTRWREASFLRNRKQGQDPISSHAHIHPGGCSQAERKRGSRVPKSSRGCTPTSFHHGWHDLHRVYPNSTLPWKL